MSKSNVTAVRVAEVCARLLNNESRNSIIRSTHVGAPTIAKVVDALRSHGVAVNTRSPNRPDLEREAKAFRLFQTTTMTSRDIGLAIGLRYDIVKSCRKRFNQSELEAGRDLPKCDCGQYLHHARLCWARVQEQVKTRGNRSVVTLGAEQRADVRRRLLKGETLQSIAAVVCVQKSSIQYFLKSFSVEELRERQDCFLVAAARKRAAKMARGMSHPKATNPNADPLYAQIAKAVPRGIDPALRDDMISQAYLEVLEGKLDTNRLADGVRKIRGRVFKAFANPWGAASLDALASDGSGRSMINNIPDGATAFV